MYSYVYYLPRFRGFFNFNFDFFPGIPLSENELRHCINIICMLAGDACNRAKIRMSGALKKLIERAKITDLCPEITMVRKKTLNFFIRNSIHLFFFNNFFPDFVCSKSFSIRSNEYGFIIT